VVRNLRAADPTLISLVVAESVTANLLRAAMQRGRVRRDRGASDRGQDRGGDQPVLVRRAEDAGVPDPGGRRRDSADRRDRHGDVGQGRSGKTVTATNLAVLLAQQPNTSVCLVDADLQFGDVCLVLQLEPKFTVVNAAAELHRLDEQLLDSILTPHHTGLKVLAAPLEPAFADDITTAGLLQIIDC
jgi:hypothetical protein